MGQLLDKGNNDPLIGATVYIEGTNIGTITDVDGKFTLNTGKTGNFNLVASYVGYETMTKFVKIAAGQTDLGTLMLGDDAVGLGEVVVMGLVDVAESRNTPVAVSTITRLEIQNKSGNTEFPDVIKNTPSVYVSNQIGGFGDSQVFTRGFDQTNTAFLLNGQPINGMEDGKMYWSNWSGMNDVASSVQVQRGLGASKLAISSVGGTVNIITKATDSQKGGSAGVTVGNDGYLKGTVAYNTGMMSNKIGVSALLTHWQGNGWAEGTKGQGQNYFLSVGYAPNDKHNFNFLVTGAPQWHDQNFAKRISDHEDENGNIDRRYNNNYGTFADGTYLTERRNYYHKPVANVNWAWKVNEKSKLSTVLYGSWGRGGGTGGVGSKERDADGKYIDWDATVAKNEADPDGNSAYAIRASANNHQWYGLVSTYDIDITDNLNFSIGTDLRNYTGEHFRQIVDLLGADQFLDTRNLRFPDNKITATYTANPWSALTNYAATGERYAWDYNERITYGGLFGQLEYSAGRFSTYVQGSASLQNHVRWDRYQYDEANETSESISNPGFNVKGGANYDINKQNGIFFNTGFYSRQPYHDNLYLNFGNDLNPVASNEDVIGLELGYRYRSSKFDANVNLYRTNWNNRVETRSIAPGDTIAGFAFENGGFVNTSNLKQLHQGVEVDIRVRPMTNLTVKAFGSAGDWTYNGISKTDLYNDERLLLASNDNLDLTGVKVGGSAQTTFGLGLTYDITKSFDVYTDYNYFTRLYGNSSPFSTDQAIDLPSYGTVDLGLGYKYLMSNGQVIRLRANVYNLLDAEYISYSRNNRAPDADAANNYKGVNKSNQVAFGVGRTWNLSLKYSF